MTPHDLLDRIEALRVRALADLDPARQAALGQHFTPIPAAQLIAAMVDVERLPELVRVLDPGAGSGVLLGAVVERLVRHGGGRSIEVTAIELDESLVPALRAVADACIDWGAALGCDVTIRIRRGDFIQGDTYSEFDVVVMNPPYAKLGTDSIHRTTMSLRGADCPNIYAAFMAAGVEALRDGGQLVAITPRSYANGPYFGRFREFLLAEVSIDRIHTFESRSTVFAETGVLQENVILAATKAAPEGKVILSTSNGHADDVTEHLAAYADVVHPDDPNRFIRLTMQGDAAATESMAAMPATLSDLGLAVSTGKVVDFRARDHLKTEPGEMCAPLVYPANIRGGIVEWPRSIRKAQWYSVTDRADANRALMPAGVYVVVKRFSSKEERRRIVAAVWVPATNGDLPVAFENHLNVFHSGGEGLDFDLARGLSLWLNSTVVDQFFRTFSGHTQVNATDLRTLRYPTTETLRHFGAAFDTPALPAQFEIDALVTASADTA